MFTLLSGLWKHVFSKDEYYVVILGLDDAGKTTLLERFKALHKKSYVGIPLDKITPTVGLNVGRVDVGSVRLLFWDLGGQKELHSLWENYYHEAHGVIFVIDSSAPERLRESKEAFDHIIASKELQGVPIMVVCNKQDKEGALTISEVKEVFNESAPRLGVRDCKVENASAIQGNNVKDILAWMAIRVQRNPQRPPATKSA